MTTRLKHFDALLIHLMVTEVITEPSAERGQRFPRTEFAEEIMHVPGDVLALA